MLQISAERTRTSIQLNHFDLPYLRPRGLNLDIDNATTISPSVLDS